MNTKDLTASGLFMALGVFVSVKAAIDLKIGSALNMGSGYFPVMLGGLLFVLGAVGALKALRSGPGPIGEIAVRGAVAISLSALAFALAVRPLGLVPALFLVAFVSACGSRLMTVRLALTTAAVLTVVSVVVFHYGIGLTIPLFPAWLMY